MDNDQAARLLAEYLEQHHDHIDDEWYGALDAAYASLTQPHEYVVQLENGSFLEVDDGLYIVPTLAEAEYRVSEYETDWDIPVGTSVVNLFRITQASWDNGEPIVEG